MSQILIISDSHYLEKDELESFFQQFKHCAAIIHCGDIYANFRQDDFPNLFICKGNNDYGHLPRILNFTVDSVRFTIIHGHINHYAYQPESLVELLEEYPADVICFGHTHVPYYYKDDKCIIINPGSLSLGRTFPRKNTYALFDTQTKVVHFYDIKTMEETEIKSEF